MGSSEPTYPPTDKIDPLIQPHLPQNHSHACRCQHHSSNRSDIDSEERMAVDNQRTSLEFNA